MHFQITNVSKSPAGIAARRLSPQRRKGVVIGGIRLKQARIPFASGATNFHIGVVERCLDQIVGLIGSGHVQVRISGEHEILSQQELLDVVSAQVALRDAPAPPEEEDDGGVPAGGLDDGDGPVVGGGDDGDDEPDGADDPDDDGDVGGEEGEGGVGEAAEGVAGGGEEGEPEEGEGEGEGAGSEEVDPEADTAETEAVSDEDDTDTVEAAEALIALTIDEAENALEGLEEAVVAKALAIEQAKKKPRKGMVTLLGGDPDEE